MNKNEKGFGVVEIVLILVIVTVIGFVGFMIYNNHKATTPETTKTSTSNTPETTTPTNNTNATPVTSFVNIIQDDESVTQSTPDRIAKTSDQIGVLNALHGRCKGDSNYVTVNHVVFDDNTNYKQEGNYAYINANVCDNIVKNLDELVGSGTSNYLHKNSSGTWIFDTMTQEDPVCTDIDGLGYPSSIISKCFDGSVTRAPR